MNRNLLRSTIHTSTFPQFGAEKDLYQIVEHIQLYKRIDKLLHHRLPTEVYCH